MRSAYFANKVIRIGTELQWVIFPYKIKNVQYNQGMYITCILISTYIFHNN
jgi:hypothetical protein